MSKKVVCSICGLHAPRNPREAGWVIRGHHNVVCPECRAEAALKAKARGGRPGAFGRESVVLYDNDSIPPFGCQENSQENLPDFIAFVEHQFAEGARRVRLV